MGEEFDTWISFYKTEAEAKKGLDTMKRLGQATKGVEKVWTMRLTDKLQNASREGLPYYAIMPPTLLAIGAQEERQSLLE